MALAHIYVAEGFEEVEMITVADILRRAGIEVVLVSLTEKLAVTGAHAITVQADQPFQAATGLADAIILQGAVGMILIISIAGDRAAAVIP